MKLSLISWVFLLLVGTAEALTLHGKVVAILDGDTVKLLDNKKTLHKIRLLGIDAPEKNQPFGSLSQAQLSQLVFNKDVVVDWRKHDRYGRVLGKISAGGVDAGYVQVQNGYAWHYVEFQKEQLPADRPKYAAAELSARRAKLGLWVESRPTPPWDFRKTHHLAKKNRNHALRQTQ